jgi:cytochrome c biogenesis protein
MSAESHAAAEIVGPSAYESVRTNFVRFWSSVKLAVVLIVAIALASTVGTIVPQGDVSGIQNIEGMSERTKNVMIAIQAHNVYYSAWFLGLLSLFFLNLAVCTYVRVWPRLKFALRKPQDIPLAARDHMPEQQHFPGVSVEEVGAALRKKGFRTFEARHGGLLADQNRLFRFAPMIVHIGLFAILIGGITAGLMGFKHSFPMLPGEAVPIRGAMDQARQRGVLTPVPADFQVRLDKFWMTHYEGGAIKQFYSTLSVLEGGKVQRTETIRVNEPLAYKGVYFYQSFWGIGAESLRVARGIKTDILMSNQGGSSIKLAGYITTRFGLGDDQVFGYTGGPGRPWYLLTFPDLRSYGELRADRTLEVAGRKLRLGPVTSEPGLSAITLRFAGRERVVPIESARRFKLSGYISRQLKIGPHTVFLFLADGESDLQIVDLDSFATLAQISRGATRAVGGFDVAFIGTQESKEATGLSSATIILDEAPTEMRLVDLARTGMRVQGPSSGQTELGGKKALLIHNAEPPGQPLWIIDGDDGTALAVFNPGDQQKVGHSTLKYEGPILFSGLQTKSDPGIPVIYTGFLIVVVGTLIGMFSHKQVWITPTEDGCRLSGKANRGRFLFHQDMQRMRDAMVAVKSPSSEELIWANSALSTTPPQ